MPDEGIEEPINEGMGQESKYSKQLRIISVSQAEKCQRSMWTRGLGDVSSREKGRDPGQAAPTQLHMKVHTGVSSGLQESQSWENRKCVVLSYLLVFKYSFLGTHMAQWARVS